MQSPNSTTVLLAILLVVLNKKDMIGYIDWLHFKITTLNKLRNERRNNTDKRPRGIHH